MTPSFSGVGAGMRVAGSAGSKGRLLCRVRQANPGARRWVRPAIVVAAVAGYVAMWAAAGYLPIQPNDIDAFFWPSAKIALAGHPLLVYMPLGQAQYGNANGPLSLVPLVM